MIDALLLLISLWLLFNLFLFAWLGRERSAQLWNAAVDRFDHVLHGGA